LYLLPSPQRDGRKIVPDPAFVIKTGTVPVDRSAVTGGTKVFINVTESAHVPGFRRRTHITRGEEVEGLHVPISLGPPRTDVDKAGRTCTVYDIIVNPEVTAGCRGADGPAFRQMVVSVVLENVEAKFGRKADRPWTLSRAFRLPSLASKYKGTLPPPAQWVRNPRKAGIESVETDDEAAAAAGRGGATTAVGLAGGTASVDAARDVTAAAVAGARMGADGTIHVPMRMHRLSEDEDGDGAGGEGGGGAKGMEGLTKVGRGENDAEEEDGAEAAAAAAAALSKKPAAPARAGPLIREVDESDAADEEDASASPAGASAGGLREVRRVRRRVRPAPGPPARPTTSVLLRRTAIAGTEAPAEVWRAESWTGSPLASGPADGDVASVEVEVVLDPRRAELLDAAEEAVALPESRRGSIASLSLLAEAAGGADIGGRLAGVVTVSVSEELIRVSAPGHEPAEIVLPVVLADGSAGAELVVSGGGALVRVTATAACWPPREDPSRPDAGAKARTPATAPQVPSWRSGPAPAGDAASFAEDRFHAKDPLSLHYLQERERAKADAERKRAEKEAAASGSSSAPMAAPSSFDLESEADIALL